MSSQMIMTLNLADESILLNKGVLEALDWPRQIQILINREEKMLVLRGIDQKLDIGRVLQLADAGIVKGNAVAPDGHGGIVHMGHELPPHHLVAREAEIRFFRQALRLQPLFSGQPANTGDGACLGVARERRSLPVVGYLVGSFAGSIVGSFVYQTVYKTAITFCAETGVTLFGLVDQDYRLPDDIIEEIGIKSFDYDTFGVDTFEPESFSFESFEPETFQPDTLGIRMLRRGVIGVTKIGYI